MQNKKIKVKMLVSIILVVILIVLIILLFIVMKEEKNKFTITNEENKKESLNIPDGFYYVGGTINTGVIISDNEEDYNKGQDYNTSISLKGNQYVWIPVDNPIAQSTDELNNMVKDKKYPIALKDGENYKGILYNLTLNSKDEPFSIYTGEEENKSDEDNCNREPAVLTIKTYGDSDDLIENSTGNLYQDSFNKMVKSVIKNKGFYVSRYEIGNLHGDKFVSKALQNDISNLSWIDGYKGIKNMYNSDLVSSEMIWGCQWDAIMTWLYSKDEVKNSYFTENTNEVCNHTGSILSTASNDKYSQKNIFDLIGNVAEFTQEAEYSSIRIARGGSFDYESEINTNNMLIREEYGIMYPYSNIGFRSILIF